MKLVTSDYYLQVCFFIFSFAAFFVCDLRELINIDCNVVSISLKIVHISQVKSFLENEAKGTNIIGATSMEDMVSKLKSPKRVMLLVKGKCSIIYI